jgi:hypothetical protein
LRAAPELAHSKGDEKWKDAGNAYIQAAKCSQQANQPDDAANDYIAAAKAFKLSHPERALAVSV